MVVSYTRVGRTTRLVEKTMRSLDRVLATGLKWTDCGWEWRELSATKTVDGERIQTSTAIYIPHTKWVKVKGMTTTGHVVTAIARFEGSTHSFLDGDRDESEPLEMSRLAIKVRTAGNGEFRKTCFFENQGADFIFR
jgi:hypothetical protein